MRRVLILSAAAAPMSVGMGYVISAMFPAMSSNVAGLVGGALTLPALMVVMASGLDT